MTIQKFPNKQDRRQRNLRDFSEAIRSHAIIFILITENCVENPCLKLEGITIEFYKFSASHNHQYWYSELPENKIIDKVSVFCLINDIEKERLVTLKKERKIYLLEACFKEKPQIRSAKFY